MPDTSFAEKLGVQIRKYKYANYDATTWSDTIEMFILKECEKGSEQYFTLSVLMSYFTFEPEKRLTPVDVFMRSFDAHVQLAKEAFNSYQLTEEEITKRKVELEKIKDNEHYLDRYALLKQKVFLTSSVNDLIPLFEEMSQIIKVHFKGDSNYDILMFSELLNQFQSIRLITQESATKKEIESLTGVDAGYFMAKMCDIGVFKKAKKGRYNIYIFQKDVFATNTLRGEWEWLRNN